jgi:hypothetical protein
VDGLACRTMLKRRREMEGRSQRSGGRIDLSSRSHRNGLESHASSSADDWRCSALGRDRICDCNLAVIAHHSPPNAKEQVRAPRFDAFVQADDSSCNRFRKCLWHEHRRDKTRGERHAMRSRIAGASSFCVVDTRSTDTSAWNIIVSCGQRRGRVPPKDRRNAYEGRS